MPILLLVIVAAISIGGIALLIVGLALWLVTFLLGRVAGVIFAVAVLALLGYFSFGLGSACLQSPQIIPPDPGTAGLGRIADACDAPGGMAAFPLMALSGIGLVLFLALSIRIIRSTRTLRERLARPKAHPIGPTP